VGTKTDANTTLNADHGSIDLTVPENGPDNTRSNAAAASGALFLYKVYSLLFSTGKSVHGAGSYARGVLAESAGHNDEPVFHTAAGSDPDTRLSKAVALCPP
jgi:hypothetical protein